MNERGIGGMGVFFFALFLLGTGIYFSAIFPPLISLGIGDVAFFQILGFMILFVGVLALIR